MEKEAECCTMQLIDADGTFNAVGLDNFIKQVNLGECGLSYAVVAIMGQKFSGKSTLLNHLFHTNFKEMDAYRGRSPTTKGIWMARSAGIEPCTVVMDLEGTDRGEDNTAFEKQAALFALAVSDIVLINMWCHDIGFEQAATKPLLKIVFQVMLQLFSPRPRTLIFVLRDRTKTPLEKLKPVLREDIQKIWDSVPKSEAHKRTPLSKFFDVQAVALSSYEDREEQFKEQVASLRKKFVNSIAPGGLAGLAGDRRGVVHASGLSSCAQQIWKVIKEYKVASLRQNFFQADASGGLAGDRRGFVKKNKQKRQQPGQTIKLMSNLKKIADLNLGKNKVDLMQDSIFGSLSSVTNNRESSPTLVKVLCKYYDPSKRVFKLNDRTSFSFCAKEIANIIGMKDSGIDYQEYIEQYSKFSSKYPNYLMDLKAKFVSNAKKITAATIKDILRKMTVEDAESKKQFRKLMTYYLIEEVLLCSSNTKNTRKTMWWMVRNLEACESVNWAKATEDHLHTSMVNAKAWLEKRASGEHPFAGAAPVLESIIYDRIPKMRPPTWSTWSTESLPIQKYESQRKNEHSIVGTLSQLDSTDVDIVPCPHCTASNDGPLAVENTSAFSVENSPLVRQRASLSSFSIDNADVPGTSDAATTLDVVDLVTPTQSARSEDFTQDSVEDEAAVRKSQLGWKVKRHVLFSPSTKKKKRPRRK